MKKIGIIGAGNVGRNLAQALQRAGIAISWVKSKNLTSTALLTDELGTRAIANWTEFEPVDLILVAVPDKAVQEVCLEAVQFAPCASVSGAVGIQDVLGTYPIGVFYPLQSFTVNRKIDFRSVPILIESEHEELRKLLWHLGRQISDTVQECSENDRKHLHIAAVFANNFTNHLLYQAERYCEENNVAFELLKPLITETLQKAMEIGPKLAQTGPARRHDEETINEHLTKLSEPARAIYRLISDSIQQTYK